MLRHHEGCIRRLEERRGNGKAKSKRQDPFTARPDGARMVRE